MGCGALKRVSVQHGEVKSMYTAVAAPCRSVASVVPHRTIAEGRRLGMAQLSVETDSWDSFHPARELYRRHDFAECPRFEGHGKDPNSVFLTKTSG